MPDMHVRLSSITFDDIENYISPNKLWDKLSDEEKLARINASNLNVYKLKRKLGYTEYRFDTSQDSSKVLAPVKSSFDNTFLSYLKIKIGSYDGEDTIINDVDETKVLISIDEGNISVDVSDASYVIYTIPILGATLNDTFQIKGPRPNFCDIDRSGNNILITVIKNHSSFDVEIEKKKEVL